MIYLEDLIKAKEDNELAIESNKVIICEKEKANIELEAENRVFDKLISFEKAKQEINEENI